MAKEKFLIIAERMPADCFGRFSETENCAAIDAGEMDESDPYSWIEAAFEIKLVRYREATHICSFTPSARYVWIQNYFVGAPNAAWEHDGDPEGLEMESGGETSGYGTYRDEYDERFICETFTIDTMRDLDEPMRKPRQCSLTGRSSDRAYELQEAYTDAIWRKAEEVAHEMNCNGVAGSAPILDVWTFRKWERERSERIKRQACERSRRMFGQSEDLTSL